MARTLAQHSNRKGFVKPGELIDFRSRKELTLQDRRILNLLIEHAGPHIASDNHHRISMSRLRGRHKGGERVRDSICRLMETIVIVPTTDSHGNPATERGVFLDSTTTTADEDNPSAEVTYSFSRTMRKVISRSQYWGRLKRYIVCSFQSKYGLALYEATCLRAELQTCQQEMSIEDFRGVLGLAPSSLTAFKDFKKRAIDPAVREVNWLSDFWVDVEPIRQGGPLRGTVIGFRLSWRRKTPEEWRFALEELARPKVGRKARLEGVTEAVVESIPRARVLG
jgi:Initiator Rep protein, WH2/Initiator Replication protein, WH1